MNKNSKRVKYIVGGDFMAEQKKENAIIPKDTIKEEYKDCLKTFDEEIKQVEKKAQRAMRVILWLKILLAVAGVGAVGAWLRNHHARELWAVIILGSKIADEMLDTLPYAQQRVKLPQLKLKLVDIYLEMQRDLMVFEKGQITEDEAIDRYYNHRNTWIKSLS